MIDILIDKIAALVGTEHVLHAPEAMAPFLAERRDLFHGTPLAVVRPGKTAEVAAVVRLAASEGLTIVPQGGNTGLVGGAVPDSSGRQILLSLQRLDAIREVDADGSTITVEAGATLAKVRAAAKTADRLFPLSLASEKSATIGGNLASNAGGLAVLAYGNMRDLVLGLEVVLADGRVWNGLRKLRKDNSAYDLRDLFVGSEGTLGIITAAVLKLVPRPKCVETAFCGVDSLPAALALFRRAQSSAHGTLTSAELLPRIGLEFVLAHAPGAHDPLPIPCPWYVLLEVSSPAPESAILTDMLCDAEETGEIRAAVIAQSSEERAALWMLRERMSDVQREEGGSIKHDVSVGVSDIPAFIEQASAAARRIVPDCRPVPFGHIGDGNIHFNISQPVGADKQAFLDRWGEMNAAVHEIVAGFGGSIAAEHGVGRLKNNLLPSFKGEVEIDLMRRLKNAFDPNNTLNPGVLLPNQR